MLLRSRDITLNVCRAFHRGIVMFPMIRHMALKGMSPAIPLNVLQYMQSLLWDLTMFNFSGMFSYQGLKSTTTVLATEDRLNCWFNLCSTTSFFDLDTDRRIFVLVDKTFMRQERLQFRDQASTFYIKQLSRRGSTTSSVTTGSSLRA